jgi:hypothetical protein
VITRAHRAIGHDATWSLVAPGPADV